MKKTLKLGRFLAVRAKSNVTKNIFRIKTSKLCMYHMMVQIK